MPSETLRLAGSKARMLAMLARVLQGGIVLPQHCFTVAEWQKDAPAVLRALATHPWSRGPVLVRSSSQIEELHFGAFAGQFHSHPALRIDDVPEAVNAVVASYASARSESDEVLVQPLLCDSVLSGVAVSAVPTTGAPYYVVNYSEGSDTTAVTAGKAQNPKTYYHAKADRTEGEAPLARVVAVCRELEALFGEPFLNVEFAVLHSGVVVVFQVRRISARPGATAVERHATVLKRVATQLDSLAAREPFLLGARTIYGVMPDWNPAEMLGIRPRPLALSLYRLLITDTTWAEQRYAYGYRDVRGQQLLISIQGQPFVDTRASFNSLVPASLDQRIAERLVDHCVQRLARHPELHDKIEFEVAITGFTPDFEFRAKRLRADGFDKDDLTALAASLRALTHEVLVENGHLQREQDRLRMLSERQSALAASHLPDAQRLRWLLWDCRMLGTLPFAGLARAEFLAADILRSLEQIGALSSAQRQGIAAGARTMASSLRTDLAQLPRAAFLKRYGHLRPGTYEITSARYDTDPDQYFGAEWPTASELAIVADNQFTDVQRSAISAILQNAGIQMDLEQLVQRTHVLVEARDQAKFAFTRVLSEALERIAHFGAGLGLSRDDLSYIDIQTLVLGTEKPDAHFLRAASAIGREQHDDTLSLSLPPLIVSGMDGSRFHVPRSMPNFVTAGRVRAPVRRHDDLRGVSGAIVAIPSADPGYDWIFAHDVLGLVTAYGGVNSHMAVRARALNLPAVIGAGELLYERWACALALEIDCLNHQVVEL